MSATASPKQSLRAVVFTNLPKGFVEKNLFPKFEKVGVEVARVVHLDKFKTIDVGNDIDVFVAMVEVMSSIQRTLVKDLAKKHGKRFIGLPRAGDWAKFFPAPVAPSAPVRLKGLASLKTLPPLPAPSEPPVEIPEPSLSDLQELLSLYEEENSELLRSKRELEATLKEREDAIVKHAMDASTFATACNALESRLEQQLKIRADLEEDLRTGRHYLDGIERQLEEAKAANQAASASPVAPAAPMESPSAALKAVNTKLRQSIAELKEALEHEKKENSDVNEKYFHKLEEVRALEGLLKEARSAAPAAISKETLLTWSRAVKQVQSGDAQGYKVLIEIAAQCNLELPALLAIIQ